MIKFSLSCLLASVGMSTSVLPRGMSSPYSFLHCNSLNFPLSSAWIVLDSVRLSCTFQNSSLLRIETHPISHQVSAFSLSYLYLKNKSQKGTYFWILELILLGITSEIAWIAFLEISTSLLPAYRQRLALRMVARTFSNFGLCSGAKNFTRHRFQQVGLEV